VIIHRLTVEVYGTVLAVEAHVTRVRFRETTP